MNTLDEKSITDTLEVISGTNTEEIEIDFREAVKQPSVVEREHSSLLRQNNIPPSISEANLTDSFIMNVNMNKTLDYNYVRNNMKPLDLILFKGNELVSKTIRLLQRIKLGVSDANDFSHVGMIVNTTIIDKKEYPYLEDDKLYIFESTLSGSLSDGVLNVENKSFFGTQVRDLDLVLKKYNTKYPLGWCRLKNNPGIISMADIKDANNINNVNKITMRLAEREKFKKRFTEVFMKYNGVRYDVNLISLLAALFPGIRWLRNYAEKFFHTQGFLFCSELCFTVYQELGLYNKLFDPRNVVPVDFIKGVDKDTVEIEEKHNGVVVCKKENLPILFDNPILFIDSK